ncbi:MAG: hypothetical protein JWL71_3188 [Acidobacteria bacterium]|nr:hypothetical protein [Acidobacteriota bacterium]
MLKRSVQNVGIGFCFAAVFAAGAAASDATQYWSVTGSTGIVDEGSASLVSFSDTGSATIRNGVSSGTVQLRFPVLPVGELARNVDYKTAHWCLGMLYRDDGAHARVVVTLKSVNVTTGVTTVHGSVDSDASSTTGAAYTNLTLCRLTNGDGTTMTSFFSGESAYYVDAKLIRTAADGNPGLRAVQIISNDTQ